MKRIAKRRRPVLLRRNERRHNGTVCKNGRPFADTTAVHQSPYSKPVITEEMKRFYLNGKVNTMMFHTYEQKSFVVEYDFILEQDITIDSGEVETEIEFNFDVEKVLDEVDENLEIFCRLILEGKNFASKIDSFIFVRTTGARR